MPVPTQAELILSSASPQSSTERSALERVLVTEDYQLNLVAPGQNAACPGAIVPPELGDAVWRGDQLGGGRAAFIPTGFAALDAELVDGGWPCGCLVEVLQPQPSLLEWRLIGPCLRPLVAGGRTVVVIGHPKQPHLTGLRHLGIEEHNLLWVKADAPSRRLWATEQAIRCNSAAAILTWMPQARPEQLRRLQVLAQGCEGPVFVIRPVQARHDPSPAPLRVLATVLFDWQIKVEIFKRRGPALDAPQRLDSIPGGLQHVLTARARRPSYVRALLEEAQHALGRPADHTHPAARTTADAIARAASHA
jgi:protein ImuA